MRQVLKLMNQSSNDNEVFQRYFEAVNKVCAQREQYVMNPDRDFVRTRKLPMGRTMSLVVFSGANSTKNSIDDFWKEMAIRDQLNSEIEIPYQSAVTQQRKKLKPAAFEAVLTNMRDALYESLPTVPLRRYAIDGTDLRYDGSVQRSENDIYFHNLGKGRGYREQNLTALYDLEEDQYTDAVISGVKNASEPADMCILVDRQKAREGEPILYIADRGFCSYNCLAHLQETGQLFLVRGKDIDSNGIASGLGLPDKEFDIDIEIRLGRSLPVDQALPKGKYNRNIGPGQRFDYIEEQSFRTYTLRLRVVRFRLSSGEWELLFTNLPRETHSAEDVKDEYAMRWGEEVSFRDLKYTIGALSFHSRIDYLITQEIWAELILFNIVTASIHAAVTEHETSDQTLSDPSSSAEPHVDPIGGEIDEKSNAAVRHYAINLNQAAHVVRTNLISHWLPWHELKRRILMYKEPVIPDRHKPRHTHPRRRFYLNYRAA